MKKQLFALLFSLASISSFGAGYQVNLQGIREMAMGGTGTAWMWDASTIFYNPAGLSNMKSIQAYASVAMIMPSTSYSNSISSYSTSPQTFLPFNFYFGGPVHEDAKLALGLGIYTDAGIGLQWPDQWIGRYIVQSINLSAVCFQPTVSYRFNDFISAGAGFVYAVGSFSMSQSLPVHGYYGPGGSSDDVGEAYLQGNATGVGFNVGVHFKPTDNLQIGLTYRSQINMNLDGGTANFNVPSILNQEFPTNTFTSLLPLPQVASIGIGYRPTERLTLEVDANYTGWNSFDTLIINFNTQAAGEPNQHLPRHYRNTLTPRIGANYKISRIVSVMLGGYYDPTPVTNGFVSPDLPDADRICFTGGAAIRPLPRLSIIAAFEATDGLQRVANYEYGGFSGTYKTEAAIPALAIYYNF